MVWFTDLLNWYHTIKYRKYAIVLLSLFVSIIYVVLPLPQLHSSTLVSFPSLSDCTCPCHHSCASVLSCLRISTHTLILFFSSHPHHRPIIHPYQTRPHPQHAWVQTWLIVVLCFHFLSISITRLISIVIVRNGDILYVGFSNILVVMS